MESHKYNYTTYTLYMQLKIWNEIKNNCIERWNNTTSTIEKDTIYHFGCCIRSICICKNVYVCMLILLSFYYHLNKSLLVDVKCFQPWYIVQYDYHCLYFISDGWARSTSSYFRLGGPGSFGKNSSQKKWK